MRLGGFRVGVVDRILPGIASAGERARTWPRATSSGDRGDRHEARQAGRAAAGGHARADPAALGAGPEVHLADARAAARDLPGRRHDPAQAVAEADRARRLLQHPERRVPDQPAHGARGLRHRARRAAAQRHQRDDPRPACRSSTHLEPVMTALSDPDTELRNLFRQAGPHLGADRPGGEHLRASCSRTWAPPSRRCRATPDRLRARSSGCGPTLDAGIDSFPVQRPFLRDTAAPVAAPAPGGGRDRALAAAGVRRVRGRDAGAGQGADPLRATPRTSSAR